MANFVLLYTGGSAGRTPAEREKIMVGNAEKLLKMKF